MRKRRNASRVGLFGILGSGNLGNDASLESVLAWLHRDHPGAELSFMCMGTDTVAARYGGRVTGLQWYESHAAGVTGRAAAPLKAIGRFLDAFRTLIWVRRQDVVIVPGMGVLETTTPVRPWAFPFSLFCLSVSARLVGTKLALVSVGASRPRSRLTRRLVTAAARLASYRSFRDGYSRDTMSRMGVEVGQDRIFPDLAFALPAPSPSPSPLPLPSKGIVGVGLMAFRGGEADRSRAETLYRGYVDTMALFVQWLLDAGRDVELFTGDQEDDEVVQEVLAEIAARRPELPAGRLTVLRAGTITELMAGLATFDSVVASRYHNVLCSLLLARPTLSISYATKHDVLMAEMGVAEFCHPASSIDLDVLVKQFDELERNRDAVTTLLADRSRAQCDLLGGQFATLSRVLF